MSELPPFLPFDPSPVQMSEYYQNLLIVQYQGKPKARATVGAAVAEVIAGKLWNQLFDGFDVSTASGKQLDVLAKFRGINRSITGLDFGRNYFTLPDYDDAGASSRYGFGAYDEGEPTTFWVRYEDTNRPTYSMNDDELRRVIKFVGRCHSSNGSVGDIDSILWEFFGSNVYVAENNDMITHYIQITPTEDKLYAICSALGLFPKPAGSTLVLEP